MADGQVRIDAVLVTDKFDKQIKNLETKVTDAENKKFKIQAEIKTKEEGLKKADDLIEKIHQDLADTSVEAIKVAEQLDNMSPNDEGYDVLEQKLQELSFQMDVYEELLKIAPQEIEKQQGELERLKGQYEELNGAVEGYKQKIEDVKIQKQVADVKLMKKEFGKTETAIQKVVGKIGGIALALVGLRAGMAFLNKASSELASYDKQYAANLQYISFALTQAIAPVLRWIVDMALKLLQIIGMIVNALFGFNIFANAGAKNFQKMKNAAGGTSKAAKELKKTMAGFDEMNVLQKQNTSGGGVGMPSMDLSKMGGEPPEWLKWIVDNKDLIFSILAGILAFILAMKAGLGLLTSLGIGVLVAGIVYAIQALLAYLQDPSWENFGKIIIGIGVAIAGLGLIIMGVMGVAAGLPILITGIVVAILGIIIANWDKIKVFLQKGVDWLGSKADWVYEKFGFIAGTIYTVVVETAQLALNIIDNLFVMMKGIFDGFIMFIKGAFTGDWKMAWEGIKKIFVSIITAVKNIFMSVFNSIMSLVIKIGTKVGDLISGAFKGVVNVVLGAIENILNNPIRTINGLIDVINEIPGVDVGWHLDEIHLPRLAKGGLINMPGRGTLLGGAIAGESGVEGVLPLTDSQMMEQLGEAIGRYITINANIVNKMNGRTISRELQTIKNNQDFAFNS